MAPQQPPSAAHLLALVQAQASARQRFVDRASAHAAGAVNGFNGWYDTAEITAWAAAIAKAIESYQRALARTTDAYLARVLTAMAARTIRPAGVIDVTGLRGGVTHAGAYGRVADTYRWQQAQWDSFARSLLAESPPIAPPDLVTPIDAALNRAATIADLDMQLAHRAQAQRIFTEHEDSAGITGYRRIVHPERSRHGSCGLCIVASDRTYHVTNLLPVHPACECTVMPILADQDPGLELNRGDLDRIYSEAGGTAAAKLKATRYQVDDHGELGPVLNREGERVRTERDADRDRNRGRSAKTPAEQRATVEGIHRSLTPALDKAHELAGTNEQWGQFAEQLKRRVETLAAQASTLAA